MILQTTTFAVSPHASSPLLLTIAGIPMSVPIQNLTVEKFLRHSILYTPHDVVHDGLPWFGASRDDWMPGARVRHHTGLDIYGDTIVVVAAAEGEVIAVGRGKNSGGNITIRHRDSVETMYVHLSSWNTYVGAHVKTGDIIGNIAKPEGNAVETQLHWAIRVNGKFINPISLIRKENRNSTIIMGLLDEFEEGKAERIRQRENLIDKK